MGIFLQVLPHQLRLIDRFQLNFLDFTGLNTTNVASKMVGLSKAFAEISSSFGFSMWTYTKNFCFTTFVGLKSCADDFDQNFCRVREPFSKHLGCSMKRLYVLSCLILASIIDPSVAGATSGESTGECKKGSEGHLCRAENGDPHAMFKVGRAAYMEGRETGDLSKAYKWAWDSKELGDRWGRQLLKMIYINTNLHHDPVEAHRWLTRALNEGNKRLDYVIIWKDRLEITMTKEQIQEANSQTLD
ncbi:uncharacterized protein METZ01_LOCUS243532 [marine metagenome]|uniref:Sel1 repeat family protein n=1 Tax=marine metagenome TaxID=408172 RepID=A0A382HTP5_9ZZZZ